jgi:hypothetical protein
VVAEESKAGVPVMHLLTDGRAPVTLLYWIVNFTNLLNLYFLAGLLPTILTQSGLSSSTSAMIAGMMQLGGTIGTFGLAWLIAKNGFTPMLTLTFAVADRTQNEGPRSPSDRKLDDLEDFSRNLQRDGARRKASGRARDPEKDW